MPDLKQKKDHLEKANYRYHFRRDIYFNAADKKIFSLEAIEDHDPSWLDDKIKETPDSDEWRFYFNTEPSDTIKREILKELQK